MRIHKVSLLLAVAMLSFSGIELSAQDITSTSLENYMVPSTPGSIAPCSDGFIQRWMLLEPIIKPNRGNTVFVDSYIRDAFATEYFKDQFSQKLPKDGSKVTVGEQTLQWHAFDSKLYNVKLFRFATNLTENRYGVIFWFVTVVNAPEDMTVRLSAGSNSASMWWLNGEEALILSGDRRMVADDGMSKRITLKKGANVLRGAVINGPGMSDFCVRFLSEDGTTPITNITISNQ